MYHVPLKKLAISRNCSTKCEPRCLYKYTNELRVVGSFIRVATVREKVLENEKISRSGKSQGITFSVREILKKNEKIHGKVREFQNFLKKMLVNRLLEILASNLCSETFLF